MEYKKLLVSDIIYNNTTKVKCDELWLMCNDNTIRSPHGDLKILKWEKYKKDLGVTEESMSDMKYDDKGEIVVSGQIPVKKSTILSGYKFELLGHLVFDKRKYAVSSALLFHQLTKIIEINNREPFIPSSYSGNLWWQMDFQVQPQGGFFTFKKSNAKISIIGHYALDNTGSPEIFKD